MGINMDDFCALQDKLHREGRFEPFYRFIDEMCLKRSKLDSKPSKKSKSSEKKYDFNIKSIKEFIMEKLEEKKKMQIQESEKVMKLKNKKQKIRILMPKPYKCLINGCDKSFTSSYGLKYHSLHGHTVEKNRVRKPYSCTVLTCKRKYKNRNGLKYHLQKFHSIDDMEEK